MNIPRDNRKQADGAPGLIVTFTSTVRRTCLVDCVLDLALDGTSIGIEILDVTLQCGDVRVPSPEAIEASGVISLALDPTANALYVRLADGSAPTQVVTPAIISIADDSTIAAIQVLSRGS